MSDKQENHSESHILIREEIAELEHQQWQAWINAMIGRFNEWREKGEELSKENLEDMINYYENKLYEQIQKWQENNIDYEKLSEDVKEYDREYADKNIKIFEKLIDEKIEEYPNRILKGMGIIESNRDRYTSLEIVNIVVEILKELKDKK